MLFANAKFDWDSGNWPKCGVHGVSQTEIEYVIKRAKAAIRDPFEGETRLRIFCQTESARFVFVALTVRERDGKSLVRPISARYMHRKEVEDYEKTMARFENR
jgi:uncharacterized protein